MNKTRWIQAATGLFVIGILITFVIGLRVQGDTVGIGDEAYNFELEDQAGELYQLDAYKGKPVVLNFFSTWCKPCESQAPEMMQFTEEFQDEVYVFTVVKSESKRAVERFIERTGYDNKTYVFDFDLEVSQRYGIVGQPETVIIDENGVVADHIVGSVNRDVMAKKVSDLLNN
ncbi:TlpA family protein disulfide reductase [Salipaludibacillus aurantiacus]|uniref:Peroxiredoxin n=1 Tax=Salipaludibacillus aurantiacus TaxID=1601833 RepID=A0A1H9X7G4_9BACI|nr:TlpA disulfide reductase family protein [Salipaludibacillus aurantiacus]SES42080.1 Peroxiredoxin [Salipaludibacillus aurantiacus]